MHALPSGFLSSEHGAPAHTEAHVGMLSLMFAAAEERQGGRAHLVQSLECFAMKLVSADAISQTHGRGSYHLQQTKRKSASGKRH